MDVGDFIGGGEEGAEGSEGVAAFSLHPLAAHFELEGALGVVVVQAVAGDVVEGVGFTDVEGFLSDDDGELDFPVGFVAVLGDDEVVVWSDDGGGGFEEDDGFGGWVHAGFFGVVFKIESDADDLAGTFHDGAEAGVGIDFWAGREVGGLEGGEAVVGEEV